MWLEILNNINGRKKAIKFPESLQTSPDEAIEAVTPMKKMNKIFGKSLKIRQVDAGSCNACEWECTALTNPVYDVQEYGVDVVASPEHADAILATGPVSRQMELALKKIYIAMPEPKLVISCGDCTINGGIYKGSDATKDGVSNVVSVYCQISGCPPSPETIIKKLLRLMKDISSRS
jgi:Ni,Fe-hydrogenase III small subunit